MQKLSMDIIRLSQSQKPTIDTFAQVIKLTINAFRAEKPLFAGRNKTEIAEALRKSTNLFNSAYRQYSISLEPEKRQNAQMSLSGLFYITDEMKEYPDIHSQFSEICSSDVIKSIIDYIDNTTGVPAEFYSPEESVDVSKIPKSHVWWFFVDEE